MEHERYENGASIHDRPVKQVSRLTGVGQTWFLRLQRLVTTSP